MANTLAALHQDWAAVQELKLRYQNPETIWFTIYPYCGNSN